ncbi:MAG TPA: ABC transporter permease [Bryobacteraceae bacterium]|nr:ABC transporter permease [Bryobacteraceae bacterium]
MACWFQAWIEDVKIGLRQLIHNRGVTTVIAVSLALGLGGAIAVFSLLDGLLYKSLPVPEPERLMVVTHGTEDEHGPSMPFPVFSILEKQGREAAELFAYSGWNAYVSDGTTEQKVLVQVVSGNFYSVLRINPQLGRLLGQADNQRGGLSSNAAVLSDRFWRNRFQADSKIIGKKILIDGIPLVVIGITPRDFFGVSPGTYPDVTITFAATTFWNTRGMLLDCWDCNSVEVMGRLAKDASVSRAEASLRVAWRSVLSSRSFDHSSETFRKNLSAEQLFVDFGGSGPDSYLRYSFVKPLNVLLGMSGLILLVACSSTANLLLARGHARRREVAIRLATGAPRRRIVQQFLTESLLLGLVGLGCAGAVYQGLVRGLLWFMAAEGNEVDLNIEPDARIVLFSVALVAVTVLLSGFLPAVQASRVPVRTCLAENSQRFAARSRFQRAIVAMQLALSLILLSGAMLLARSLYQIKNFDAGFRRDHLLIASPDFSSQTFKPEEQTQLAKRVVSRLQRAPGVRSASVSTLLPGEGGSWSAQYVPEGFSLGSEEQPRSYLNFVSTGFFNTMGTPLLLGRDFNPQDGQTGSAPVAIVSESFARHFWGTDNPLGKRIRDADRKESAMVVGMARDARHKSFRQPAPRTVYLPFPPPLPDGARRGLRVEIWTYTNPESLMKLARQAFNEENSHIPVELQTFDSVLDRRLLYEHLLTFIAFGYAVSGILLAVIGIYGVTAQSTSMRTLEVGIRAALGATGPQIIALFVREHLLVSSMGLLAGLLGASWFTGFLRNWLFAVSPKDWFTFVASTLLLFLISVIATLIPAAGAVKVDPIEALRFE